MKVEKYKLNAGASPQIFTNALKLRKRMTPAEKLLWDQLKDVKKIGYKFRRQHPFSRYILDFYCHELSLCIELDGEVHETIEQQAIDKDRTETLKEIGIVVIRFKNIEIIENIEKVVEEILEHARNLKGKREIKELKSSCIFSPRPTVKRHK